MDNLCHTLAGWALGEAGLKKRTPYAMAALFIGANLPDVDGLAYLKGPIAALAFRRGVTHGILAMVIWPFALAGLLLLWDRARRRRGAAQGLPPRYGPLLLVSAAGVLSHPLLDLLNTYGIRLLSPFSERWFYGDALFIADPWMWLLLGGGAFLARRAEGAGDPRATLRARGGLALAGAYAATMFVGGQVVAGRAAEALAARGRPAESVLAAPLPVTPLRRKVLADLGEAYAIGEWDPLSRPALSFASALLPKANDAAVAARAAGTDGARRFLSWSRYPVYETLSDGSVRISDLRFRVRGLNWAALRVSPPAGTPR